MTRQAVVLAAVVLVASGPAVASAAERAGDDAEDALIRKALELRKRGDDAAARVELERAYAIARSPRAAAQLGFAEQALGLWPQADIHVSEALRSGDDPWIKKNRATVEEALTTIRQHVGRIEIVGGRPGADVIVNGQRVGAVPLAGPVAVSAGPVDVELRSPGQPPLAKSVSVAAGEYARVPFTLPSPAPPAPAPPPIANSPVVPAPVAEVRTGVDDGRRRQRLAAMGLLAGGVTAVAIGVACTIVGNGKFEAINEDAAANRPYDESNGNWRTYETTGIVLYAVGGAALAGGTFLYLRARGRERAAAASSSPGAGLSLAPILSPKQAGAAISVRF
jgi:hypothetical protein